MQLQVTAPLDQSVNFISKITQLAIDYTPKILGAVIVYLIGSMIIRWVSGIVGKMLKAKNVDASLQGFLASFVKIMLTILLLLSVFGMLGVNLTSFAAILAGLAVGVGAALNGTLGNFAGGIMMLLFKPFKVGDIIEAQGHTGTVTELGIFNTFLLTPENKTVVLANGAVSTGTIVNYNKHGNLRVDLQMAIDPNMDINKARAVATEAMLSHPKVLKSPAPEVSVLKVGDGMVSLAIRPYTTQADYWVVLVAGERQREFSIAEGDQEVLSLMHHLSLQPAGPLKAELLVVTGKSAVRSVIENLGIGSWTSPPARFRPTIWAAAAIGAN